MKKLFLFTVCVTILSQSINAQVMEIIGLVTNKIIKAVDLKVQSMQNATINLQIAQKELENELSENSLGEIGSLTEQQKELCKKYYASLKQVKVAVSATAGVIKIRQQQRSLNELYNLALNKTRQDLHFTPTEQTAIQQSFKTLIDEGAITLEKLEAALKSNTVSATDAERIKLLTRSSNQLEGLLYKLQTLYERTQATSIKRARDKEETERIRKLYAP